MLRTFAAIFLFLLCPGGLSAQDYDFITDVRDGQQYLTVKIGDQEWLAENLRFKPDNPRALYLEDGPMLEIFGRYYSWEMAREVCPDGWHLPSEEEWSTLGQALGGEQAAGGKMRKVSNYWSSVIDSTSNSSGFSALPGGFLEDPSDMGYPLMGEKGLFWSAAEKSRSAGMFRYVEIESTQFKSGNCSKEYGLTVRCIRD